MAADAEGATKLVAPRRARRALVREARTAARAVARSQLVQCSLYGNDPYWGRVLSELGASGARFDPERVDIAYKGVVVCRDGVAAPHDDGRARGVDGRSATSRSSATSTPAAARRRCCFTDLTHAYVDENMGTS